MRGTILVAILGVLLVEGCLASSGRARELASVSVSATSLSGSSGMFAGHGRDVLATSAMKRLLAEGSPSPASYSSPPPPPPPFECIDRYGSTTPDGYTCEQQKGWGKCKDAWLIAGHYCAKTCGRCSTSPSPHFTPNNPPPPPSPPFECIDRYGSTTPDGYTCAQQKVWGKCQDAWLIAGHYCAKTCGRCVGGPSPHFTPNHPPPPPWQCIDVPTPEGYTCEQQKGWGKCSASWLIAGHWCAKTCGRCTDTPTPTWTPSG